MEDIVRKHIVFYGRVQGVGFRYHSYYAANSLGLTGTVRNLYDGSVEMEVQGSREAIDELVRRLNGQRFIDISDMSVRDMPLAEERSFEITD